MSGPHGPARHVREVAHVRELVSSRWTRIFAMVAILGTAFFGVPALVNAADPNGADTIAANPNAGLNMAWTLIAGFLVFFMQLGFAFLGAGLGRSKHPVN